MWQLTKVPKTDWIKDDSGYYTLINWIDDNTVRLDIMDRDDMPVVSFQGAASDVRKRMMQNEDQNPNRDKPLCVLSFEHAAYIGAELARCELMQQLYVQD